jgi:hypothetical protein
MHNLTNGQHSIDGQDRERPSEPRPARLPLVLNSVVSVFDDRLTAVGGAHRETAKKGTEHNTA